MESYADFAAVYDEFMEDTPYDEWAGVIADKLNKYGITDGIVADLGAGTGEMTRRLAAMGYDMIGIDNSEEMLAIAKEKGLSATDDILYLCQDMREFELYGTVRAIVSVCDCVNYILDEDELTQVFKLCNNYLDPGGVLIFDFNTVHKYRDVIGETTIADTREDSAFIWDNFYDEDTDINEYDLTFFVKEDKLYRRFEEVHLQRGYSLETMKKMLERSGLKFTEAFDADTGKAPNAESERIVIVAMECGKRENENE